MKPNLGETIRKGLKEEPKLLDLDSFGEVMDSFIRKSAVRLMVSKDENSEDWKVKGAGCGAVMDFFIFLNALEPIYVEMLDEMDGMIDGEKLAGALADLLKETMIAAARLNQ